MLHVNNFPRFSISFLFFVLLFYFTFLSWFGFFPSCHRASCHQIPFQALSFPATFSYLCHSQNPNFTGKYSKSYHSSTYDHFRFFGEALLLRNQFRAFIIVSRHYSSFYFLAAYWCHCYHYFQTLKSVDFLRFICQSSVCTCYPSN